METIYGSKQNIIFKNKMGVGLGSFDGLHTGHMILVNTLLEESKLRGLDSVVYTFTEHPENIIKKQLYNPLITTVEKKEQLLGLSQLDYLYFDEFNEEFSHLLPEEFVRNILVEKLNAKLVVVGFNYRFGYKGKGDVCLLREYGEKYGFDVIEIPPIKIDDEIVSSTLVRHYISEGNMEKVLKLLGRRYSIRGFVKEGKKLGGKMGFPTANTYPDSSLIMPSFGVYATRTLVKGKYYNSITNVGKNPTFGNSDRISVETFIFDFNEKIYGEEIEVFFVSKIRDEIKFSNKEELITQIKKDIEKAKVFANLCHVR